MCKLGYCWILISSGLIGGGRDAESRAQRPRLLMGKRFSGGHPATDRRATTVRIIAALPCSMWSSGPLCHSSYIQKEPTSQEKKNVMAVTWNKTVGTESRVVWHAVTLMVISYNFFFSLEVSLILYLKKKEKEMANEIRSRTIYFGECKIYENCLSMWKHSSFLVQRVQNSSSYLMGSCGTQS